MDSKSLQLLNNSHLELKRDTSRDSLDSFRVAKNNYFTKEKDCDVVSVE